MLKKLAASLPPAVRFQPKASKSISKRLFSATTTSRAEIEIFVDGKALKVDAGSTLIQACEKAGATIPRFCYHDRLAVAGNCRMCLVEVERVPKPVASCAYPLTPGMKVFTDTPMVHKAREGVMEFLLSNHPLDCPICDQGGECDLQDQSIRYGSDRGRFREFEGKRAVEDKDFGPLVKTTMTRCIQCTRCVRFANEIAGAEELGTSGRGNDMQIGMYIEKTLNSELSGNIIDLCPVGALTSKPYEFTSRPWELKKTESIDVMDAIGSHIRIDSRGLEVMRILPRLNEDINEEWISDKTRFACDGLKRQRLTTPLIRDGDKFVATSWQVALQTVADRLRATQPEKISAVAGQLTDTETMVAVKDFFARLGSSNFHLDGAFLNRPPVHGADIRSNYVFNGRIPAPEEADVLLLVGTNPRKEGPILNVRIRKSYLHSGLDIGLVGEADDLKYEYEHLGTVLKAFAKLADSKSGAFMDKLSAAKKPMIIIGSGAVEGADGAQVYASLKKLAKKLPNLVTPEWNGINFFQRNASVVGALDVGFIPGVNSKPLAESEFVYLLGADDLEQRHIPKGSFVVYQGHHGDTGAQFADVILPGAAYTEKTATYVNTEGRSQMTRIAVGCPGDAREDWKVVRALSEVVGAPLPYDDMHTLHERLAEIAPHLTQYGVANDTSSFVALGLDSVKGAEVLGKSSETLESPVENFYMTDVISRSSATMAKCTEAFILSSDATKVKPLNKDN